MNSSLPDRLRRLEHRCGEPFFVVDSLTWAGTNVFSRLAQPLDINPVILDGGYPKLKVLKNYVRTLPVIAAWIEAHPEDYSRTESNMTT